MIAITNTDLETDFENTKEDPFELKKGAWVYRKAKPYQITDVDETLDP